MRFDDEEGAVLERLDRALRDPSVRGFVEAVADRLDVFLAENADAPMAWESVPLSTYGDALAEDVRSSWVFVLRAGRASGPERHPNSRQRMMSLRGGGDFPTKVRLSDAWSSNELRSDLDAPLEERWVSIPPNTWHQGVVGDRNWAVVSFQTASEAELIEERPVPGQPDQVVQKRYVDE